MQHVNNLQQFLDHSKWQTYDEKFLREFPRNTSKRAAVGRFETCQIVKFVPVLPARNQPLANARRVS